VLQPLGAELELQPLEAELQRYLVLQTAEADVERDPRGLNVHVRAPYISLALLRRDEGS
jgi:hypothetical protein